MTEQNNRPRGLHQISLVALFTIGNTLLRFPWATAEAGITISFLLSIAAALLFGIGVYFAACRLFRVPFSRMKGWKIIACLLLFLPVCVFSFFLAVKSSRDLVSFFDQMLLPGQTALLFAALYLAVAAWLSRIPRRGMDSFALLLFLPAVGAAAVLFLLGIPQFQTGYGSFEIPSLPAIGHSIFPLFSEIALPMLPLGVYLALAKPKKEKKQAWRPLLFGILSAGVVLLFCVLQTLLTFGASYAASLEYPYSAAVGVVSLGAYAFRPELISYLLDFFFFFFRVSVCFSCVKWIVGRFLPRLRNVVPPLAALLVFVFLCLS